jgi:hypothetical protein
MNNNRKDYMLIDLLIAVIPLLTSAYIAYYFKAQNIIVFIFMVFASLLILPTWYFYKCENSKNEVFNWYSPIKCTSIMLFITFGMYISLYLLYPQLINVFADVSSNISYPYFIDNSSLNITGVPYLENDTIRDYIGTIASSIVALNSIIISITLLIIQYVSDKRGTILMDLFFKDKYFWGYIGITVITVLLAIFGIITIPQNTCVLVLGENLGWNVSNIGLVILTGILLINFYALFEYLKRVSEILSPSKSIWYILDAMAYSEIKNYNRVVNNKNNNDDKIPDYAVLFRIYKIIKGLLKNNDLDVAVSCIKSLGTYYEILYKKYKNERNARGFFISYSYIIEKLAEIFIDDLKKGDIIKEPYWHRVLETLLETLYKIAEVRINDNKDIGYELDTMEKISCKIIYHNFDNPKFNGHIFVENIIEHINKIFKKEIEKLEKSVDDEKLKKSKEIEKLENNIRWCCNALEKISFGIISILKSLNIDSWNYTLYPNLLIKIIGILDITNDKNHSDKYGSILDEILITLNNILVKTYKENIYISLPFHEQKKIDTIHKNILKESYRYDYEIFYRIVNTLKEHKGVVSRLMYQFSTDSDEEKIKNILELILDDIKNLEYELLMASLDVGFARTKLEDNCIFYKKYSIEEIKKAKEELEQNLSKYVEDDEIKRVKRCLNNLFETFKNKSSS